jgi:PKD repeat protein
MVSKFCKHSQIKILIRSVFKRRIPILIIVFLFSLVICAAVASPNGTETLISTDTVGSLDSNPAIYNNFIVWLNDQNVLDLYNLSSGEMIHLPVTDPSAFYPAQPAIYKNTVIWQEWDGTGSARIVRYNIPGRTIQNSYDATYYESWPDHEFTFPKTDGTTIVWQNYNMTNSDWDIVAVRPGWISPRLILYSSSNEKHPAVYGTSVVYENWTDPSHAHIWRFNLSDNTSVPVSGSFDQETFPQIFGNRIAWQARNISGSDTSSHIDIWETGVMTRLTPLNVNQKLPVINGNRVVVEDYRRDSSKPDVYVYEFSQSWTETWVAPNNLSASQFTPAIWNNRIVWEDTRAQNAYSGSDSDIYLFTLGSHDICPTADFSPSTNAGPDPLTVVFTDRSAGSPVLYRIWNYSNRTTSFPLNPAGQTFNGTGVYHARLTIGNTKCRNTTPSLSRYDIYVDSPPDADFTAAPIEGFAPLAVQFIDTSGGGPTSWTWDFGDGSFSHSRNPVHSYTTKGRLYTVSLTVNNTFAGMAPDTRTRTDYIRTFLGSTRRSAIPVPGITVIPRYGGLFLLYNATMLPDMATPLPTVLTGFHPGSAGWQNITFISPDPTGFSDTFGNNTYMGNLSSVIFQTDDVRVSGISPGIGTGWGVNYLLRTSGYPSPASISTAIWEGATTDDQNRFLLTIIGSNFVENPDGIAYTAHITKNGFPPSGNATLNMSVDRSWIGGKEAKTYIIGYGVNSQGETVGGVLPARYLFNDGTLDYFEAEVPDYFTTFGISPLSGTGNFFQLITLSVSSHINPPAQNNNPSSVSDSDSIMAGGMGGAGAGKVTVPVNTTPATSTPAPKATGDPGKTAIVYTNTDGVVTQATRLQSTDGRATISISEGTVAKDAGKNPLSVITIKALPPESLPQIPSGSASTYAGMAYEIGPDGATFSPPVLLAFTPPQSMLGEDYAVRSFDQKSGTWQDLPTTFDATAGTVTAQVSHLCVFALFTEPRAIPGTPYSTPVKTTVPLPAAPQVTTQPPTTAVSIFVSMISWAAGLVVNHIVILVAVIILIIVVYLVKRRFPGSGQ